MVYPREYTQLFLNNCLKTLMVCKKFWLSTTSRCTKIESYIFRVGCRANIRRSARTSPRPSLTDTSVGCRIQLAPYERFYLYSKE